MDISSILLPFGIFRGHLVYFVVIWVYFCSFGMLYQETSGNPVFNLTNFSLTRFFVEKTTAVQYLLVVSAIEG
jgi:hypothetical protein